MRGHGPAGRRKRHVVHGALFAVVVSSVVSFVGDPVVALVLVARVLVVLVRHVVVVFVVIIIFVRDLIDIVVVFG